MSVFDASMMFLPLFQGRKFWTTSTYRYKHIVQLPVLVLNNIVPYCTRVLEILRGKLKCIRHASPFFALYHKISLKITPDVRISIRVTKFCKSLYPLQLPPWQIFLKFLYYNSMCTRILFSHLGMGIVQTIKRRKRCYWCSAVQISRKTKN